MKGKCIATVVGIALWSIWGITAAGQVNVNSADAKTIAKELNGVGDATAARIVAERTEHGPFKSAEDLAKRVKGVGPKVLEKNKSNIKLADK